MDTGVTTFSQSSYDIHQMMMWICIVIGITVCCAMIYSILYHRKSNNTGTVTIHNSIKMEILWTLIPFLFLIALAVPAVQDLLNMQATTSPEVTVVARPNESIKLWKL